MHSLDKAFIDELAKLAEAEEISVQALRQAKLNPELMRRVRREGPKVAVDGQTRSFVRELARDTLALAKRSDPKLTLEVWRKRIQEAISTRRPGVAKSIKKSLSIRYKK
jgi:hypothetical protein